MKAGYIDVDEMRDLYNAEHITSIEVYEDMNLKRRAIGFIWPDEKRIDLSEAKTTKKQI